ncbi:DUF47 domain-containing protein [Chloroflexota bacterium]
MKFPFVPREEKFFGLFEESAQNLVKGAGALKALVTDWRMVNSKIAEIHELEHTGDSITHDILAQLHRTFVPPFDREDIALLTHTMDDVMDFIDATAEAMFIYKIKAPTPKSVELAEIIVKAVAEVEKGILGLRGKSRLKLILKECVEINRLENMADQVYRAAMAELFDESSDFTYVIKWREIYEHMEAATDRCEDVANVLEGVALKHA